MKLGLGTGSTVSHTVIELGRMMAEDGLEISGIPTSNATARLAKEVGIPLLDWSNVESLDLVIDGADEVDRDFQLIKGGGGALTREKIVANIGAAMVVVADPLKDVEVLGGFPLPVEILPFGWQSTIRHLQNNCPGSVTIRRLSNAPAIVLDGEEIYVTEAGGPFVTDNGNLIVDCKFGSTINNPVELESRILTIPGVVEVGLFNNMCDVFIIGSANGVEVRMRPGGRLG
jgi:ribose 5-phosphate isomerase A